MPYRDGLNNTLPALYLTPDQLTIADNILFGLQGERRKRLGTARYNAAAIGVVNVTAFQDFWRFGASLTPTQRFVAVAGTNAYFSTGNGVWTSLGAFGTNTSLITNIAIAQGYAVFSNGVDIPQKWDQTTFNALDLTLNAPRFTAASYHLRRLFAVGTASHPSQVDVSAGGDITLWTGGDTVSLPLDEDDGDAIMGISKTFHKRIYVFKGPNSGSIHELSGNTLASLTHDTVFNGLPLLNHKAIITTDNDIYWISRYGVHSLRTTIQYGDLVAGFLSLPIQELFQKELAINTLNQAWGFWHPLYNIVGWFVTPSGNTQNTWALIYHYLISDPNPGGKKFWSIWKFSGLKGFSGGMALTPNTMVPRLYIGGTGDGFVYQGDQTVLTDANGSAYTATIRTGIMLDMQQAGGPLQEKQFYGVTTFFEPVGPYTHNLSITVDNRVISTSITMGGLGDTLG